MSYADRPLSCRDCGREFVFTAGEQQFYDQKGFTNPPTRCTTCRQQRKSDRGGGGGGGGYSGGGGGGYSGGGGGGYGGGGGQRESHQTTCAECGQPTTVPFVPRGDRPVYCSDCFRAKRTPRY